MVARAARRAPVRWVGLDLGSQSLKLVELEPTPQGVRLINSLIQDFPLAPSAEPDRIGWLQAALKEFDHSDVHVSVSGPEVALRRVQVPMMPKGELPEAVKWQVKEQLPFPIQDAVIDFQVIGEVWDKDVKKQDVLVAAASSSAVRSVKELVEAAGGHIVSLKPTALALWRGVERVIPDAGAGSVAVIELGATETHVTLVKDGQIRVVRDLAIGSRHLTEALVGVVASERGDITIDLSKAEAFKRRYGVFAEAVEGTTEDGVPLFHLASLMRPVLENLLTELSRLLDFYKVQVDEAGVSRLLLCGGGASLKSLQPFLADGLGMTVEIFNPLMRLTDRVQSMEPEQVAEGGPRLAVAIGLAMDHGQGLNLLPRSRSRNPLHAIPQHLWVRAAQAAAAVTLVLYLGLLGWSLLLGHAIGQQRAIWNALEPSHASYLRVTEEMQRLERSVGQVGRLMDQQPVWDGLFKEVGELLPPTMELDEMAFTVEDEEVPGPMRLRLKGRVLSGVGSREGSTAQFLEALEASVFFTGVALTSSEMRSGETNTVTVDIEGRLE